MSLKKRKLIPGPGKYDTCRDFNNKGGFSFRIRNYEKSENNENIGPGRYNLLSTFGVKNSSLFLSKFKNKGFCKINPLKKNLLKKKIFKQIFYDSKNLINKNGKYFNSKFKNTKNFFFLKQKKKENFDNNPPGPGEYILPSDFGIYKSSNFDL